MYRGARASGDGERAYFRCFLAPSGSCGWQGQPRGYLISRSVMVVNRRSCLLVKTDISEGAYSGRCEELEAMYGVIELSDDIDIFTVRYLLNERDLKCGSWTG